MKVFTIVGNWKMNPDTREEASALFSSISRAAKKTSRVHVIIAPPAPFLRDMAAKAREIKVSAQDVSEHARGAFTGSISAQEVKSLGAEYAIIGHSERRKAGDTDAIVAQKIKQATDAGLRPIVCVGEAERDAHAHYLRAVREQVVSVMGAVDPKKAKWITIAYEPTWAVGKGYDTALKPADIHEMSLYIKKVASDVLGKKDGIKVPILYGGSVDFSNAKEILANASIDGLLIGRQSLDSKAFGDIIAYADSL